MACWEPSLQVQSEAGSSKVCVSSGQRMRPPAPVYYISVASKEI
jgi:hypothetical protein